MIKNRQIKKPKKIKTIEDRNNIENFLITIFNAAEGLMATPIGAIFWIIILCLFAALVSGGDLECGKPDFFGHDGC